MPQEHAGKDMPVWGSMFLQVSSGSEASTRAVAQMRVRRLTDYVKSLQQK